MGQAETLKTLKMEVASHFQSFQSLAPANVPWLNFESFENGGEAAFFNVFTALPPAKGPGLNLKTLKRAVAQPFSKFSELGPWQLFQD